MYININIYIDGSSHLYTYSLSLSMGLGSLPSLTLTCIVVYGDMFLRSMFDINMKIAYI